MRPAARRVAATAPVASRASARSRLLVHNLAMVLVQEQAQDESEEEEDAVHDAKGKSGLQHSTCLINMQCEV